MENETQKLKILDEKHNQLMKDWRDNLKPRKKVGVACNIIDLFISFSVICFENLFSA